YGLTLALLWGPIAGTARADLMPGTPAGPDPFIFTFDEKGNASYQIFDPCTGKYGPPVVTHGKLVHGILTYRLPEFVTPGDVVATDPGQPRTISDVVRFSNDECSGLLQYFSDGGEGDLADRKGIPALGESSVLISEVGPEDGNNGFTYMAGHGNPATTNFY